MPDSAVTAAIVRAAPWLAWLVVIVREAWFASRERGAVSNSRDRMPARFGLLAWYPVPLLR